MSEGERGFTRRNLLKGGAVGAAGLYLGGAAALSQADWGPRRPPRVTRSPSPG